MSQLPPPDQKQTIAVSNAGLQLRTLDEVWRFATCLAKSGLAPKGIETAEAIVIAVQMGFEVGLPPMAAMQNIAVINGRPSIWGDAQLAVVRGTGELEIFEEWYESGGQRLPRNPVEYKDDTTAVCRVKRRGYEPQESAYSVADAKRAGLWAKSGPWSQVPFRMLRMRARSFVLRDAFGDALRGLMSAEEVRDLGPKEAVGRVVNEAPEFLPKDSPPPPQSQTADPPQAAQHEQPAAESPPGKTPGRRKAAAPPQEPALPTVPAHQFAKGPAPDLTLSSEPETPRQKLQRIVAKLDPEKFAGWLSTNLMPPVAEMADNEVLDVLALAGALEEECRP